MTEFKGTKGEITYKEYGGAEIYFIIETVLDEVDILNSGDVEEMQANAQLICEAFNVANETGQTPLQLKEMLERAVELIKYLDKRSDSAARKRIEDFLSEQTKKK